MRVLLAGLFVYIGMMSVCIALINSRWTTDIPPTVLGIASGVFALFLAIASYRLFNRRTILDRLLQKQYDSLDFENLHYHFSFNITATEMLCAERAERCGQSGMNAFFRGIITFWALTWVIMPFLPGVHPINKWLSTASVLIGLLILRSSMVRPFLARQRIRRDYSTPEAVEIRMGPSGLDITTSGHDIHRSWDELVGVMPTGQGLVLYWEDETKIWLPASAVGSEQKVAELVLYLKSRLEPFSVAF